MPKKYCCVKNCNNNESVKGVRFCLFPTALKETCRVVAEAHPHILEALDGHMGTLGSHKNGLIRKIVGCYVSMRGRRSAKMFNEQNPKIRMQMSKINFLVRNIQFQFDRESYKVASVPKFLCIIMPDSPPPKSNTITRPC